MSFSLFMFFDYFVCFTCSSRFRFISRYYFYKFGILFADSFTHKILTFPQPFSPIVMVPRVFGWALKRSSKSIVSVLSEEFHFRAINFPFPLNRLLRGSTNEFWATKFSVTYYYVGFHKRLPTHISYSLASVRELSASRLITHSHALWYCILRLEIIRLTGNTFLQRKTFDLYTFPLLNIVQYRNTLKDFCLRLQIHNYAFCSALNCLPQNLWRIKKSLLDDFLII